MTIITPPPPAPNRADPATFADRADAYVAWWSTVAAEINAGALYAPGAVLQVVQGTTITDVSVTGTTWTDTSLTATITPASTASKMLILVSQQLFIQRASSVTAEAGLRLLRGSTAIGENSLFDHGVNMAGSGTTTAQHTTRAVLTVLDSPSTANAVTYKTQMAAPSAFGSVNAQNFGESTSYIILMEITG